MARVEVVDPWVEAHPHPRPHGGSSSPKSPIVVDETNKRLPYDKFTKAPREAALADEIKKRFSGEDMTSPDGKCELKCFSSDGAKYEGPPPKEVKGGKGTIQKCIDEFKANP